MKGSSGHPVGIALPLPAAPVRSPWSTRVAGSAVMHRPPNGGSCGV